MFTISPYIYITNIIHLSDLLKRSKLAPPHLPCVFRRDLYKA